MGAPADRAAGRRWPARRTPRPRGWRAWPPGMAAECAPLGRRGRRRRHVGQRARQRRRRPLRDRAGRPRGRGPGAAVGGPPRGRRGAGGPARLVGVRARGAAPRLHQPGRRGRRAPAARRRPTPPARRPRRPARRRCATSATGCWPTSATSPRPAGCGSTSTGPRSCAPAWSRRARCSRSRAALGRGPDGVGAHRRGGPRAGGHLPGRRRAARGVDGGRRRGPAARACPSTASPRPPSSARSARRGPGMSTSDRSAERRLPDGTAVRLRAVPLRRPGGARAGRAGAAGVRAPLRRPGRGRRRPGGVQPPVGSFLVAEVDGVPAGCGGWRVHGYGAAPGTVEVKRVYVEPGVPPARARAAAHGRAGGRRGARPATGRSCSTRADRSPRRWRCTPRSGTHRSPGYGIYAGCPARCSSASSSAPDASDDDEEERPWAS